MVGYEKVADACVVGVYDDTKATELPTAIIAKPETVKNLDESLLGGNIVKQMEHRVANHKKFLGGVRFADAFPKSAAEKILRRVLRHKGSSDVG